jgi:hypothetical protein
VIYQFCRESKFTSVVMPSHGRFVGASSLPRNEYQPRPGERAGHHWRITSAAGRRVIRYALYDTNYWKTFVQARLGVMVGDRGYLTLYGKEPETHRLFADHLTAEYRVKTEGRGRTVDEWKIHPERRDNHSLDGAVGASMAGVSLAEHGAKNALMQAKPREKFSEIQRRKREERERNGWRRYEE